MQPGQEANLLVHDTPFDQVQIVPGAGKFIFLGLFALSHFAEFPELRINQKRNLSNVSIWDKLEIIPNENDQPAQWHTSRAATLVAFPDTLFMSIG